MTTGLLFVHVMKLSLALIELIQICLLKRDSGMSLINFHGEAILNSLDREILAHRPELVIDVSVVCLLSLPLTTH